MDMINGNNISDRNQTTSSDNIDFQSKLTPAADFAFGGFLLFVCK